MWNSNEVVGQSLNGLDAGIDDRALRDLADRREGHAATKRNLSLRDALGLQMGQNEIVKSWRGIHGPKAYSHLSRDAMA